MKSIHEIASLSGVTVRTLQYYDRIGLLVPESYSQSGYRQYSIENLFSLQKILIYKELGFSLAEIKNLMQDLSINEKTHLEKQKVLLSKKQEQIFGMIDWIDHVLGGKREINFEAFKNAVTSSLPDEIAGDNTDLISPDSLKNIQTIWGDKTEKPENALKNISKSFENRSVEDLKETAAQSALLQQKIAEENIDQQQAFIFIQEWLDFDCSAYHITDQVAYLSTLLESYKQNPELKKLLELQLGTKAAKEFILRLEKYNIVQNH